jgi:hypothetical protein
MDKPMTFVKLLRKLKKNISCSFITSTNLRLALAVHMANAQIQFKDEVCFNFAFFVVVCCCCCFSSSANSEVNTTTCLPEGLPKCLLNSLRTIHLGCDFHVDENFTGMKLFFVFIYPGSQKLFHVIVLIHRL